MGGKPPIYGKAHETDVPQDAKLKRKRDEAERKGPAIAGAENHNERAGSEGEGEVRRCPAFQVDILRAGQQETLDWGRRPDWTTSSLQTG